MERMDVTLEKIIPKLSQQDLNMVIDRILNMLDELHSRGIVHGDPHIGNIMLKAHERKEWDNFDSFGIKFSSGQISMKFVDFGFANTITHLIDNLQPSINLYEGILLRLHRIGCNIIDITRGEDLFSLLKFYDFANIFTYLTMVNRLNSLQNIVVKENELLMAIPNSGCIAGESFERQEAKGERLEKKREIEEMKQGGYGRFRNEHRRGSKSPKHPKLGMGILEMMEKLNLEEKHE